MFKKLIIILSALILLCGCRTSKEVSKSSRDDYRYVYEVTARQKTDSVYIHVVDTVKITQKGDTIYNIVTKWRTEYRIKQVFDTLIVHDTIRVHDIKEQVITVTEKLPFTKRASFVYLLIGLVIIAYLLIKNARKWIG